jgi:hypothetical protein
MAIIKRRLDICGREKAWEYLVGGAEGEYRVSARQVGREEPSYMCSCGKSVEGRRLDELFLMEAVHQPCSHISEVQRDLSIARHAAAQMMP